MEGLGISVFDLVVLAVFSLTALIGLATGLARAGLFLASWLAAIVATLYLFPTTSAFVAGFFRQDWAVTLTAGLVPFLVILVALSIVSRALCSSINQSGFKGLDRAMGLVAGLAAGAAVLAIGYLPLAARYPEGTPPGWIAGAVSLPVVVQLSAWAEGIMPDRIMDDALPNAVSASVEADSAVSDRADPADAGDSAVRAGSVK